jgi:hypothetical protein
MYQFTSFQQSIINYLIAENEEIPPPDELVDLMRAIQGRYEPDMRFTLCNLENNGLILYVLIDEHNPGHFKGRCADIKNRLMEIADFIHYLWRKGAVRTIPKEKTESPPDLPEHWQAYTGFAPAERNLLYFASSVQVVPRLQLYDYWEAVQQISISVSINTPKVLI